MQRAFVELAVRMDQGTRGGYQPCVQAAHGALEVGRLNDKGLARSPVAQDGLNHLDTRAFEQGDPVDVQTRTMRCNCAAPHEGREAAQFGCGGWWNLELTSR